MSSTTVYIGRLGSTQIAWERFLDADIWFEVELQKEIDHKYIVQNLTSFESAREDLCIHIVYMVSRALTVS